MTHSSRVRTCSNHSSDWETQSEEEISAPLPLNKDDALQAQNPRLTEVPISALAASKSVEWAQQIVLYSHTNKCYERVIVSYYKPKY